MRLLGLFLLLGGTLLAGSTDLSGEWKSRLGDDPRFASPTYDDSGWDTVTLPRRVPIPRGISWLRKTVQGPIAMSDDMIALGSISPCYEVFLNGVKVGGVECLGGRDLPFFHPRAFPIPAQAGERVVIALRREAPRSDYGGINSLRDEGPYLIAPTAQGSTAVARAKLQQIQAVTMLALTAYTQVGIAILLLFFWWSVRERLELLWFALCLLLLAGNNLTALSLPYLESPYYAAYQWLLPMGFVLLNLCAHAVLRQAPLPGPMLAAIAAAILVTRATTLSSVYTLPAVALPVWLSLGALRRGNAAQRAFAIAILTYALSTLNIVRSQWWPGGPIATTFYVGPYLVNASASISTFVALTIMLAMLHLVANDRREKYRLAAEVEAARGVQQLMLASGAGNEEYTIDAVYLPATEVGGDFYQRLDDPAGGFTMVVGDVSGKGLKAAMLVSMAIGALRKDPGLRPGAQLTGLNGSLGPGMDGGFITCLCARFEPGGRVTIANAGHLAPYHNGKELVLDNGLPLGLYGAAEYAETEFVLAAGDRMTFLSDGVVEAANAQGELFGFARTAATSIKPASEIAAAARAWGQNDDITVVTVRRRA